MANYLQSKGITNLSKPFCCLWHNDTKPSMGLLKDGIHLHCFACGCTHDLIDLISLDYGCNTTKAVEIGCDLYNIPLLEKKYSERPPARIIIKDQSDKNKAAPVDYTSFYLEANKHITETKYHRGISLDTLNRFKVGYVENWKHPNAPDFVKGSPRLIIPISKYCYIARYTGTDKYIVNGNDYTKQKVTGGTDTENLFFNFKSLNKTDKSTFIVEGEIDALSILDCGYNAVSLGSISLINRFTKQLKRAKITPKSPFIILLDDDHRGQEAAQKLADALQSNNLPFYWHKKRAFAPYKDPNEAYCKDKNCFINILNSIEREVIQCQKK